MTYEEILAKLKEGSDRWGVNFQPRAEVIAEFLSKLPLKHLEAQGASLEFETEEPLTPSQAYTLAQFGQEAPEDISDNQTYFWLWWD